MSYREEMDAIRRQLFDQYWPRIRPQVERHILNQGQPLTRVQVEAYALYMEETFHLGTVDRQRLQRAADLMALEVLNEAPSGWVSLGDCVRLSPLAFERVVAQLFLASGYHPTMAQPRTMLGLRVWQFAKSDTAAIGVVPMLTVPSSATVNHLQKEPETIVVVTPSVASASLRNLCRHGSVQLIDAQALAALLDKYPVSRTLITD
ncbi:MAG: hypothetical protein C7B46_06545 [Sulfobacillus benefaciens]|uniref:Uncharacterized protein n=1 Tax=Sulfobacillus benefaciens TaxID=453960 RepID=A0A2T2XI57_9FIRM|nr:MAG: hypothetical protein C7B46_06545 [Sulfobacillus benefaciens]